MKVMIINGSPKKKLGTSKYIQKTIKFMLGNTETIECGIHTKKDIKEVLEKLDDIEALVIAAPLYVDGIPSQMLEFMKEAEAYCKEHNYHFPVYVLSNCGFIEGHQNTINLNQYECWAERAGLPWGGGVGIGGGVILLVYAIMLPIQIGIALLNIVLNVVNGMPPINQGLFIGLLENIGWFLFFSSSMFVCEGILTYRIKKQITGKPNLYARFMIPAIVFLVAADIFMLILSIINGGFFRNLFHKEADL